jgi:hypothetical protein
MPGQCSDNPTPIFHNGTGSAFRDFRTFHKPLTSLACLQQPATGSRPEPDVSSLHHILFILRSILILFCHLCLGFPSNGFEDADMKQEAILALRVQSSDL